MKNPIQAFAVVDFDIEFKIRGQKSSNYSAGGHLKEKDLDSSIFNYLPRLNKQQVLEDYTPLLIKGFVWDCKYRKIGDDCAEVRRVGCIHGRQIYKMIPHLIEWIAFKGVEKGSEWEEWAIENDIPVLEVSS